MVTIPLYKPYITEDEHRAVSRVLRGGVLSRGPEVENFEQEFAEYMGKSHAIAVNNGTAGLHVAIKALGWSAGDRIITTPFSFIASANSLLFENIEPVFADIGDDYNIDPTHIEKKLTKNTRGILLVHIFGLPAYSKHLHSLVRGHNLEVIEDACEAIERPSDDFMVAKLGACTVYGFYENKQLTTGGEGGAVITNNQALAERCRSLRNQGNIHHASWLNHIQLGYNYRMTEMQAAFGRVQLKRLNWALKQRELIADRYEDLFEGVPGVKIPSVHPRRSWFVYPVQFETKRARDKVLDDLHSHGIAAREYFAPIHLYAHFRKFGYKPGDFPKTEYASQTTIVIPFFVGMTYHQQDRVATVIASSLK
ncbi:hypothetical protein A3B02_02745 [Candidatus Roizmanbacteria bacterium RIFCSPLOWO2_01_FULL_42_14]|uniref:Polysaccharide biosynthesis protein n=3 Tax=Candidatus Roizmaniibacteriota TaxID=1752723 RepID=A0A1F7JAQ1_9BACT|nr:MAG: hypothetical protein A3D08_01720 [Candidatus Roizmanbacteria bacterium RIFCSPHIGHO2_02_FULL_43_11]OGK38824.1 MAG: hypothetical protein A3F32_03010 [Candidatus Roizmanbacteria bacterium RIFCSPHIGHO2_12_FULL_42_10]OGK52689.1 MAG: hypothetical protein A3B02_02745 [Candidatus Roizmanbacteria bacterium RIFCSPLOWO2_01_FULL_42_14]